MRTVLVATAVVPTLLLTACDGDSSRTTSGDAVSTSSAAAGTQSPATNQPAAIAQVGTVEKLNGVTVDTANPKKPAIKLASVPFAVDKSQMQVLTPGTGQKITDKMAVTVDYVLVNARDGKPVASTFETNAPEIVQMSQTVPGMAGMLKDQQVGAKLVAALTPEDSFAAKGGIPQAGVRVSDPVVLYVEVKGAKVPLTKAQGTEVPPKEGMPTVEFFDDKPATITIPKGAAAPTESRAELLIKGAGPAVTKGQQVTVHYTGVLWPTGKVFDSSKKRAEPFTFTVGSEPAQVIPCWDKNVLGQTIGSRLVLVCTPADAYKDKAQGEIPANSTLVFSVDILDATTPTAAATPGQ